MVSDYTGAEWAQYAINAAQTIGYLTGCNLWLDLEGISNSASEVIPWANDWYDAVQSAGLRSWNLCGRARTLNVIPTVL